jgi:hypothetical protein
VSVTTEVHRKIYDDQDGTFLNVGPDNDGLAIVTVWTSNQESRDKYFGGGFLQIPDPEMANALADAIKLCATESAHLMQSSKI